jgi:hypothetical protein
VSIGSERTAIDASGSRGEETQVRFESENDRVGTCIAGGGSGGVTSC